MRAAQVVACTLVLGLLVACSNAPLGTSETSRSEQAVTPDVGSAPEFRYFGYYHGDSDQFGHEFMPEFAGFTNLTFLSRWSNLPALVGDAERAHALGLKVIPEVGLCFFDFVPPDQYVVKPNWRSYWQQNCVPVLRQVIQVSEVFAFFILDEPQGHGLGIRAIETAILAVKRDFPGHRTMINESPFIDPVPVGMDLYSVGCLPGWFCRDDPNQSACLEAQWAFCQGRIDHALAATPDSLKFMLTIEAWNVGSFVSTREQQLMWQRFGNERPRFIGQAWFLWPNAPKGEYPFHGTRDNPEVRATHRDIALKHFAQNTWETLPVCGNDGVTYQNPDQSKAAGTTIAHYGPCDSSVPLP